NIRVLAGAGSVDFQGGALFKWIPIPDHEKQPAMGLISGIIYSRSDSDNFFSFRLGPIISKEYLWEWGFITPYLSLPLGVTFNDTSTLYPLQFTLGAEFASEDDKEFSLISEIGFDISDSFTYVTVGLVWRF